MVGRGVCWLVSAGVSLVVARAALCQEVPWASVPFVDPLRFTSLPLDGTQAAAPRRGEWNVAASVGYFNVWLLTWHTGTIHKALGLLGKPLTDREIQIIERDFPHDQFYHFDLEGTLDQVAISYGLGNGLAVTAMVPWVVVGQPHWDAIADAFHRAFRISDMRRNWFPRGLETVVLRGRHGTIERLGGLAGSGIGDASVSLTGRVGDWLGAEHRWAVAVKAPTGERDTLRGTGGWDAGVRWFATWGRDIKQLRLGLGYTWLDPGGRWLGVQRSDMWAALIEGRAPIGKGFAVRASARLDASPLASFTSSPVGRESFYWTLGLLAPLGRTTWLAFDAGENYPGDAEVPDFSLHLQVVARVGASR